MKVEVSVPITLVIEFDEHWIPSDSLEKTAALARQRADRILKDLVTTRMDGTYNLAYHASNKPKVVIVIQNDEL